MQINLVTPQTRPQLPSSVVKAPVQSDVKFGANKPQVRFGANSENPGFFGAIGSFFSLIGRKIGRVLGVAHAAEDNKVANDPAAAKAVLMKALEKEKQEVLAVTGELRSVIGEVGIAKREYDEAVKAEAKEKAEFEAAGELLNETQESDKDYERLKKYTEEQFSEWQQAQQALENQTTLYERKQKAASIAKARINELNESIANRERQIYGAIDKVRQTQANNLQMELEKKLATTLGKGISNDETTDQLLKDIERNNETSKVGFDGKTLDEKIEELDFKKKMAERTRTKQTNTALEAALGKLKKGEEATKTQTTSATTGNGPKTTGQAVEEDGAPPATK